MSQPVLNVLTCFLLVLLVYCSSDNHNQYEKYGRKGFSVATSLPGVLYTFRAVRFREKYLKRRCAYCTGHPGSYNPSIITNEEAHMIYGNMDGKSSSSKPKEGKTGKKKTKRISDFFSAVPVGQPNVTLETSTAQSSNPAANNETLTSTRPPAPCPVMSSTTMASVPPKEVCSLESTVTADPSKSSTTSAESDPSSTASTSSFSATPCQPRSFVFPQRKCGGQNRSFQASWFDRFSWLHYNEQHDSVLCFYCSQQNERGNLRCASKKDQKFISDGFCNWKEALRKFKKHERSDCHKMSVDYAVRIPKSYGNVIEMTNEESKKTRQLNRCCLVKIVEILQYLCRQGQAIQGNTDDESNFYQLIKLRGKDDPALIDLIEKKGGDKYISHDIQNEIIEIMAHQVQRDIVNDIGSNFFSIIADEYTDISNKEQLSFCLRWVDDQLESHEDFLGFYNIPNITSDTIVSVIKDTLIRLQISLSQCRGQCYDGASNMMGKKSGVAKQIQDCQPKAHPTHCHAHSLSLGVKQATSDCKILSDTMNNTNEIVKLVKYSPKRENILGDIKSNIQYENEDSEAKEDANVAGLTKFSATRWTVRAICFKRVIDNYEALLQLWDECLQTRLESDVRGRVIGCQAQMKLFDFFFGINLGQMIFGHTDNLSKSLQNANMSAVSGQHNANLTTQALKSIRNEQSFKAFFQTVLKKKTSLEELSDPRVPRKRKTPARFEVGEGEPWYPETPEDLYRKIYFEVVDTIISAIGERFNQPSFKAYANLESLLIKALRSEDYSAELGYVKELYSDDVKEEYLLPQLEVFKVLMKGETPNCFNDILKAVKKMQENERQMISEVIVICKLLLVNPATSASGERSFSTARRIKTWLRAKMSQKRFNHVTIMNTHKTRTENIRLIDVANEFASRKDSRKRNLGTFTEQDLDYVK